MKPITQYDPQTCATIGEIRQSGFPLPKEIPDDAWVPRRAIKVKTGARTKVRARPGFKSEQRLQLMITFVEPIRRGDVVYRIEGHKVVEHVEPASRAAGPSPDSAGRDAGSPAGAD